MKKFIAAITVLFVLIIIGIYWVTGVKDAQSPDSVFNYSFTTSFSHPAGIYEDEFLLEIFCNKAVSIYYTIDGSNPLTSETRILYEGPIAVTDRSGDKNVVSAVDPILFDSANVIVSNTKDGFESTVEAPSDESVDKSTVIRAAAVDKDRSHTDVETATYFIGTMQEHIRGMEESCRASGTDLAVISISMDYDDLFDSKKGIYVKGNIYEKALGQFLKSGKSLKTDSARSLEGNYSQRGREWEREIHMEFFESNTQGTKLALSQDCGIRIQGNYSRSDLQKGFRLFARTEYGEKNFHYAVFGEELKNDLGLTISRFKTLTLRAGGNCAFTAKFNDTYWQSLMKELNCETQTSRPCVVYINGEYWGVYVLQEDYSDNYFEETHGVDNNDVVLYKGDAETYSIGYKLDLGELPGGIEDVSYYFRDLLSFFETHETLENPEDYEEFSKLVDVESAMGYFAAEIWINNKWDWPGKNWSLWRTVNVDRSNPYADGRWRFCFYDVEFGGVSGGSDAATNTIKEDNYKKYGLLDKNTNNPAVLIYAYLMTNEEFRQAFSEKLSGLSDTIFEKNAALEKLDEFKDIYSPLLDQFFERYPGTGDTEYAMYGGYATYQCIRDFVSQRGNYIQNMLDWVDDHYK